MKLGWPNKGWWILAVWLTALASSSAQEKPPVMETRGFRVPPDFLSWNDHAVTRPTSILERWQLFRVGGEGQPLDEILSSQGISFPPGSKARFYPAAQVLVVTNTPENLDLAEAFTDSLDGENYSKNVSLTVHLIQAPESRLISLAATTTSKKDQTQDLQALLAEAGVGGTGVEVVHTAFMQTRGGYRCTFESITEHVAAGGMDRAEPDGGDNERHTLPLGFRMEVVPTVDMEGRVIELNLAPELTLLRKESQDKVKQLGAEDIQTAKLMTAVTLLNGQTRLLGTWPAKGEAEQIGQDVSQCVFITANVTEPRLTVPSRRAVLSFMGTAAEMTERRFDLPREFLEFHHAAGFQNILDLLMRNGLDLPEGSAVTLDGPKHLLVKTTGEMSVVLEAWLRRFGETFPESVNYAIEIVRAPAKTLRPLIAECAGKSDHRLALEKLQAAVVKGEAQQMGLHHLETNFSGDSLIESGMYRQVVTGLKWHGDKHLSVQTDRQACGFRLNLNGSIGVDGLVDFGYVLDYNNAPPTSWRKAFAASGFKSDLVQPMEDLHLCRIQSSGISKDGNVKLMGMWRPVGVGGRTGEDVLEAAFMTCHLVRHPGRLETFEKILGARRKSARQAADEKLLTRVFKVKPDFLVSEMTVPAGIGIPDPFAQPARTEPKIREIDVFKARGIPFPEGAEVISHGRVSSQLIVKNTEANLALIEAYINRVNRDVMPNLNLTLHIIEAPAAEVRKFLAGHAVENNPAKALEALMSSSDSEGWKSLVTLNVSAKSGQKAVVEEVQEHLVVNGHDISASCVLSPAEQAIKPVGTRLEVEAKADVDGLRLDLTCELKHHFAPPSIRAESLGDMDAKPIAVQLTDLHAVNAQVSLTMMSGTSRILAVWKPTGLPKFEEEDLLQMAILEAAAVPVKE